MADKVSKKYNLCRSDIKKWLENQVLFLAPVAIIYIGFVIGNVQDGGFQVNDFALTNSIITAMVLYALSATLDLLKKFVQTKRY